MLHLPLSDARTVSSRSTPTPWPYSQPLLELLHGRGDEKDEHGVGHQPFYGGSALNVHLNHCVQATLFGRTDLLLGNAVPVARKPQRTPGSRPCPATPGTRQHLGRRSRCHSRSLGRLGRVVAVTMKCQGRSRARSAPIAASFPTPEGPDRTTSSGPPSCFGLTAAGGSILHPYRWPRPILAYPARTAGRIPPCHRRHPRSFRPPTATRPPPAP